MAIHDEIRDLKAKTSERFDQVDRRLAGVDRRLAGVDAGVTEILRRLPESD